MIDVATAVVRPDAARPGRSDVHRARAAGPLRLLCPRAAGNAAWIVTSSLGGGLVDGDDVALEVTVDAGATCVVTTQASTKVYKGRSSQRTSVRVHGDGAALVVPDPVVPFRDAQLAQVTRIDLDAASALVLCDVLTAGRVAHGERWSAASIDTTLELAVAGTVQLRDRVVLDGDVATRMRRFEALATAVIVGPRLADIAAAELAKLAESPVARGAPIIVAGSAIAGGALFRLAGERTEAVVAATRAILSAPCNRLGEDPWSRKW
ncbi:MAG: urease accessory protein UreD [Kofleriaceae bacterium]|nr:urease accessory protein UreD [Kofleriaceae bacterium]